MFHYEHTHLPLVRHLFAPYGLVKIEVDKPLESPGGAPSPFYAVGYLYFETWEGFQQAFKEVGPTIIKSISTYTDVKPLIQVGQYIVV